MNKHKLAILSVVLVCLVILGCPLSYASAAIHEKPVSGSRQKATGLPSGAREDLSWTITRTFGSRFTRPINRTLLAAARKSIEPKPRYHARRDS